VQVAWVQNSAEDIKQMHQTQLKMIKGLNPLNWFIRR